MALLLKGGYTTRDVRLGRLPQSDEQNKNFPLPKLLEQLGTPREPRPYVWSSYLWIDQQRGDCVACGWSTKLAARPVVVPNITYPERVDSWYLDFQRNDEWAGSYLEEPRYEGTSVLSGAQVLMRDGFLRDYYHATGDADHKERQLAAVTTWEGPTVIGVGWRQDMMEPDKDHFVSVSGPEVGDHCVCLLGMRFPSKRWQHPPAYAVRQTWGDPFNWYITREDMVALLDDPYADVCFAREKKRIL